MNAVLGQPLQMEPTKRIIKALGDIGHISLANTTQNLGVLWILSKFLNPTAQSFCVFAGCALLFDFVFHLIFFVAVLSVEVRRMELQDSIGRIESKKEGQTPRKTQSWLDALFKGRLPLSTRLAGSAVCIGFALAINVHFADSERLGRSALRHLLSTLRLTGNDLEDDQQTFAPPPINQARTPQAWLKLQDHQFAQEVIEFVKPGAHSMIARVYAPVIIVLKGSDRGKQLAAQNLLLQLYLTFNEHILPVLFFIVIFGSLITALMDYLLWDDRLKKDKENAVSSEELVFNFAKLPLIHKIDIFRLSSSNTGHVITVGLDRTISAYILDSKTQTFTTDALLTPNTEQLNLWPISQVAIDDTGLWAAACSSRGVVGIWNRVENHWSKIQIAGLAAQQPCMLSFTCKVLAEVKARLLVVTFPDGLHVTVDVKSGEIICKTKIDTTISSSILAETSIESSILSLANNGPIFIVPTVAAARSAMSDEFTTSDFLGKDHVRDIRFVSSMNMLVLLRSRSIDLIDFTTKLKIASVAVAGQWAATSLRIFHANLRECWTCHSPAVHSFLIAYTDVSTNELVLKTFMATKEEHPLICFHPTTNSDIASCQTLNQVEPIVKTVSCPGSWEVTSNQMIIGARPSSHLDVTLASNALTVADSDTSSMTSARSSPMTLPRRRIAADLQPHGLDHPRKSARIDTSSIFTSQIEVWCISPTSELKISAIPSSPDDLFVVTPGPIVPLGAKSVALAIGNTVRVVTMGSERIEELSPHVWTGGQSSNHSSSKAKAKDSKRRKAAGLSKKEYKL